MTKTKYIVAAIFLILAVTFGGLMLAKEYNQRNKMDCIQPVTLTVDPDPDPYSC